MFWLQFYYAEQLLKYTRVLFQLSDTGEWLFAMQIADSGINTAGASPLSSLIIFEKLLNWNSICVWIGFRPKYAFNDCRILRIVFYLQHTASNQSRSLQFSFGFTFCLHCNLFCKFLIKKSRHCVTAIGIGMRVAATRLCILLRWTNANAW